MIVCPPTSAVGEEPTQDLVERGVGQGAQLVVGAVLDRMRHEHPQRGSAPSDADLGVGGVDELARRDEHRRDAAALQIDDVVHTARRARASIGERLDHDVALRGDLVAQVDRAPAW